MLSDGNGRVPSRQTYLGLARRRSSPSCVCRPGELGGIWNDAELTDEPGPTRAALLGQLSNERMQLTKGSARAAFAADPRCSTGVWFSYGLGLPVTRLATTDDGGGPIRC